jgi:hypothetical protein
VLPSIMSTIQHQCNDVFTPHLISLVIIFPSLLCPFFCLCSRLTCCGSAKNFGQHWLCSLQIFYQSVSSDFVPILISSVLVELSICILEFLLVHSLQRVYWQAWDFPIYGAALDRVVYQDAVEYEEAGWLSQYSIKPETSKLNWHFIRWDCQILIFMAWSISTKAGC